MRTPEKEPEIVGFLEALGRRSSCWELADYWSGDRCAVGVGSQTDPRRLAYVSTWGQPPDGYYVQLELPSVSGDVYQILREESVRSVDAAVEVVAEHLEAKRAL